MTKEDALVKYAQSINKALTMLGQSHDEIIEYLQMLESKYNNLEKRLSDLENEASNS